MKGGGQCKIWKSYEEYINVLGGGGEGKADSAKVLILSSFFRPPLIHHHSAVENDTPPSIMHWIRHFLPIIGDGKSYIRVIYLNSDVFARDRIFIFLW